MKPVVRTVLVALVLCAGLVGLWAASGRTPAEVTIPAHPVQAAQPASALKGAPVGVSGCLAAACHGGPADRTLAGDLNETTWMSSGTAWAAADPHRSAYAVLSSPLADEIMAKLPDAASKKATEDARCLACHTNPALAVPGASSDPRVLALRAEGVSCEACHGNAGAWLVPHTTWGEGNRDGLYPPAGMTKLYDLGARAENCLGCHVGAPADKERGYGVRDMNHDMIAAGHPRLNFDFAEYLRRLPPHWQEKDRTAPKSPPRKVDPVHMWLVGRYAHVEAACRLLADRADRALADDARTPWPEFAEFRCSACHHDIPNADRTKPSYLGTRPPGALKWQAIWPATALDPDAFLRIEQDEPGPTALKVVPLMESKRPVGAAKVRPVAKDAAASWDTRRELLGRAPAQAADLAPLMLRTGFPPGADEDDLGQMLWGLAALQRSRGGDPHPAFATAFDRLQKKDYAGARKDIEVLLKALAPK